MLLAYSLVWKLNAIVQLQPLKYKILLKPIYKNNILINVVNYVTKRVNPVANIQYYVWCFGVLYSYVLLDY